MRGLLLTLVLLLRRCLPDVVETLLASFFFLLREYEAETSRNVTQLCEKAHKQALQAEHKRVEPPLLVLVLGTVNVNSAFKPLYCIFRSVSVTLSLSLVCVVGPMVSM